MDRAEGALTSRASRQGPFVRWQDARRRARDEARRARQDESALAANLGLAGELLFDRLADGERVVVPVASADETSRRWLYAERVESDHYGEGVGYLLAETDLDVGSLLGEPTIGALYPEYEEATFHLNALSGDDVLAIRDAAIAPEATIDPERLRSVTRAWFERAAAAGRT